MQKRSIYPDRLGTDLGKVERKERKCFNRRLLCSWSPVIISAMHAGSMDVSTANTCQSALAKSRASWAADSNPQAAAAAAS